MKSFFKIIYYNTYLGFFLIKNLVGPYYKMRHSLLTDAVFCVKRFRKKQHYELNLNEPRTFNEKIQWMKLNTRNPIQTICADKYLVRDYVEKKIGNEFLIPIICWKENASEIRLEILPDYPVIIKTNHDSSGGIIIRDKKSQDWKRIRRKLTFLLKQNYYYASREWHYQEIVPLIIVEKLLLTQKNQIPNDVKFHCINGQVEFIQIDMDRHTNHRRNFYSKNWEFLPFEWDAKYKNGSQVVRPKSLDKMIQLAESLAADFDYVRIDFYDVDGVVYFGELTFYHGGGFERFEPREYDLKFGQMLTLNDSYMSLKS